MNIKNIDKGILEDWGGVEDARKKVYIAMTSNTIWKNLFFESREQATMVIKRFHPKLTFKTDGDSLIESKNGRRFTVKEVKEYLRMQDIEYVKKFEL